MPPAGCPGWTYAKHPRRDKVLQKTCHALLAGIQAGQYPPETYARDTRPIHRGLFVTLTPPKHAYYAGNYRGDARFPCLATREVTVPADPMVGLLAGLVPMTMAVFGESVVGTVQNLEDLLDGLGAIADQQTRIVSVVRIACAALVEFLTVHPYLDGNGHVARGLLWIILFRFGYVPDRWTIHPRPPFPDYGTMISAHRRGNVDPLEQFVLTCVSPVSTTP